MKKRILCLGNNPIRKPVNGDGKLLDVVEIFHTIQGEGPYTGQPAVFIRLGGCNLSCEFCDTEFEEYTTETLGSITQQVKKLAGNTTTLVVITGGEPLRQPINALCQALLDTGYTVQLESNGTLYRELDERVEIVCSPKATNGNYHAVREDILPHVIAFKYLISASNPHYANVPRELLPEKHDIPYLCPTNGRTKPGKKPRQSAARLRPGAQAWLSSLATIA